MSFNTEDFLQLRQWTNKSLRNLEAELMGLGYIACYRVVGVMLKMLGYGLQANKKTLAVTSSHADRDAQFEHINGECKMAAEYGSPVLSIDAKKKEKIGNFRTMDAPTASQNAD